MKIELSISETKKIWNNRLADNCQYRIANRCTHEFNKDNGCSIILCPILLSKTKLKRIFKFIDYKK